MNDAEFAALQRPAQQQQSGRRDLEKRLAEIDAYRRSNRAAYFKNSRIQATELRLLAELEGLKADSTDLVETDGEDGDPDVSWASPSLVSEWREHGGVKHHVSVIRAAAQKAFDELDEQEAYSLRESFEQLPGGAQSAIYGYLSVEPASWRPASEEDLTHYANHPDTADLISSWGPKARAQLGVVLGRSAMMLGKMNGADRAKTEAWAQSLSPAQFRAIARALAR